jgi:hypothetical protein
MAHQGEWLGRDTEQRIITVRDAAVSALLRAGCDVVCDDVNLPQRTARDLARLAVAAGAGVEVWDLTNVPVEVCAQRDAARERPVGEQVIRDMWRRYLAGKTYPLPWPEETADVADVRPYAPDLSLPAAWLVDLDGTLAAMSGRSPYDWARVGEDTLVEPVAALVRALNAAGSAVVIMSGRDAVCRPETEEWLVRHSVKYAELHMRRIGDQRRDAVVKAELFWAEVAPCWAVVGVIDDRDSVVGMWRSMGIACMQCAPGDF